jgi:transposase
MLSFHAHLKVFVATAPCDLRAGFQGLWNAAQTQLGEDPRSGALFVFGNYRRNRIKILYFDGGGRVGSDLYLLHLPAPEAATVAPREVNLSKKTGTPNLKCK